MRSFAPAALVLLAVLASTAAVDAMDLAEILQRAVDHDGQTEALRMSLENTLIAAKRADLAPGFSVSLSSGKTRVSRSSEPRYGDPADALSVSPGMTIQLASPLGTEVSLALPATYDLRSLSAQRSSPTVKVRQPLNDLLGIERDALTDLELRQAIESARVALARRVQAVEKDALSRLRALWSDESTLGDLAVQIQGARRDLEQARALGSYAPGTAALARLEQALRSLERKSELQAAKQARDLRDLGRVVGGSIEQLPATVPAADLALPPEEAAASNPDVGLARLAVHVEELRLDEQGSGKKPELSVSGSYSRTTSERLGKEYTNTDVGAGLELAFDHLTVTAGPGSIEETGTLYFGAEVTWSPPARRLDDLDELKQRNTVAAKKAEVAAAQRSYLESRAELESRILDLRLQAEDLALSRSVAGLALSETAARHGKGLADDQELVEARWAFDKVAFDDKLLAVDRLLARVDLEALASPDKEK